MNVSYNWLKAIAPGIEGSAQDIAERLALLGAPVDEVVDLGAELGDVIIARVEEVWQHPNADRLRVTRVNAGGAMVQVVCGAPNVEAGSYYPFAPVGARLPGGVEIRKAKLRGEASEGMLCSARELGLGRDHAGLMTLSGEWTPGAPLASRTRPRKPAPRNVASFRVKFHRHVRVDACRGIACVRSTTAATALPPISHARARPFQRAIASRNWPPV